MSEQASRNSLRTGRSAGMTMIFILFGPIVWALHLLVIYGSQSLLCSRTMAQPVPAIVGIVTFASMAALIGGMIAPGALAHAMRADHWSGSQQPFIKNVMLTLAVLSLFGVAWAGGAALILPSCSMLR